MKSTTGTDGYFEWPKREFEKALRSGKSYELWRIYRVHTERPIVKRFRNPVSLLKRSGIRLQLGSVRATIQPLDVAESNLES